MFACKAVPLARRVMLFQSRILPILLYGVGGWPTLLVGEAKQLFGGYTTLCRQLLTISVKDDQRWTEAQIMSSVGLPGPQVCLHVERLRFLLLLTRIWAVARADDGFLDTQRAALRWLYSRVGSVSTLPDPLHAWEEWSSMMLYTPGKLKGLIRRAAQAEVLHLKMQALLLLCRQVPVSTAVCSAARVSPLSRGGGVMHPASMAIAPWGMC